MLNQDETLSNEKKKTLQKYFFQHYCVSGCDLLLVASIELISGHSNLH